MAERTQYGEWEKLNFLGKGGQGEVFRARKTTTDTSELIERINKTISNTIGTQPALRGEGARELVSIIRAISTEQLAPLGALKALHPITDQDAAEKATSRMSQELAALAAVDHPSLVRVSGSNLNERWFVMQYFQRGKLTDHLERTRGELLAALVAFSQLVEAVAILHKKGFVHRDIKPDNIFIADDGHLVLGDFGLIINPAAADPRLTDTYENVGSRDWMPGWAFGMRMDDVKPNFDVFSLGKVLWSMISGKRFLRLWYHHDQEFDLEQLFPGNATMGWAGRILDKCIVEHERNCLNNAGELLAEVDLTIDALKHGSQILRTDRPHRCWVCGLGSYTGKIRDDNSGVIFACNYCGHMQSFSDPKNKPAWK